MLDHAITSTLAIDLSQFVQGALLVLFLFVSIGMILIVLIQQPQGGGLSGAFGASADGAGQTALGVKTGDALTTATIVIFVIFLGTAVALNFQIRPDSRGASAAQVTAPAGEEGDAAPGAETPATTEETAGDEAEPIEAIEEAIEGDMPDLTLDDEVEDDGGVDNSAEVGGALPDPDQR